VGRTVERWLWHGSSEPGIFPQRPAASWVVVRILRGPMFSAFVRPRAGAKHLRHHTSWHDACKTAAPTNISGLPWWHTLPASFDYKPMVLCV